MDTVDRVRAAYADLANRPGEYVTLAAIRQAIPDASREDVDAALRLLIDSHDVRLEPEPLRHRIVGDVGTAAIRIGGEDRHSLAIGQSTVDAPTQWVNARTGAVVGNSGQVDIVRGNVVKADSDKGKAAVEALSGKRSANLEKARTAVREKRVEELDRSTDPKDNAAKIKALAEDKMDSISLYRKAIVSPNATYGRADIEVARIRHTPNNQSGEFRVIDPREGDTVGWMDRVPFDGEMMWAVRRERADGSFEFRGYAESMAIGADVLVTGSPNERFLASTVSNSDTRRVSSGRFITPDEALRIREHEARDERERLAAVAAERLRGAAQSRTVEDLPNYTIDRLLDSQSSDPEIAEVRQRAMAERIRRDAGIPFREGQRVTHRTRGMVTYHHPDPMKRDGSFSIVEFEDDGNDGIVTTDMLSPLAPTTPVPPAPSSRAAMVGKAVTGGELRVGDVIEGLRGQPRTVDRVEGGRAHLEGGGYTIAGGKYKVLSVADEPATARAEPLDVSRAPDPTQPEYYNDPALLESGHAREIIDSLEQGDTPDEIIEMYASEIGRDIAEQLVGEVVQALKAQGRMPAKALDTPRVKRDDGAMTTTAAPEDTRITAAREYVQAGRHNAASVKYRLARAERAIANGDDPTAELDEIDKLIGFRPGETTIGVKTSSKGRTTTVTLPDGTTATRTSKTRNYTHAVVATRDLHQRAQQIQADTDRRQAYVDALQAWIDRGANTDELKAYPSRELSYSEDQAGKSRNEYYLPGFEPVRKSVRRGRDYWDDPMQFSLPNFKDTTREGTYEGMGKYTGPELTAWERYGPSHVLGRQRAHIASNEKQAAELNAGPRYTYEVIRWSSSRNLAAQAASSEFSNPWTTYRVIGVGDDLTGQTADEAKPVKVKPTKAELDAAKAAKAEQEKADRAKRNEEWTVRKVADIREALTQGNEQRARSGLTGTTDRGLRMIARAFGIKSTPRGMSDRQKTEWLRNAIIEAAKKS